MKRIIYVIIQLKGSNSLLFFNYLVDLVIYVGNIHYEIICILLI
jgi:hypothetical protein